SRAAHERRCAVVTAPPRVSYIAHTRPVMNGGRVTGRPAPGWISTRCGSTHRDRERVTIYLLTSVDAPVSDVAPPDCGLADARTPLVPGCRLRLPPVRADVAGTGAACEPDQARATRRCHRRGAARARPAPAPHARRAPARAGAPCGGDRSDRTADRSPARGPAGRAAPPRGAPGGARGPGAPEGSRDRAARQRSGGARGARARFRRGGTHDRGADRGRHPP